MRRVRPLLRNLPVAAIAYLLLSLGQLAMGGQGFTANLPVPPTKPPGGLSLLFDCTWADGYGYAPVRITINSAKPAGFERRFKIEITNRTMTERFPISVTSQLQLPAGATTATKVVPYPRCSVNSWLSLNVWQDGVRIDELCFEDRFVNSTGNAQGTAPATLFVTSGVVDISQFDFLDGANTILNYGPGSAVTTPAQPNAIAIGINQIAPFASMPAKELSTDWITYNGLDLIFISLIDVEDLAATRPRALEALRDWTAAGGNLCVYGCTFGTGDKWNGIPRLEELLKCASDAENGGGTLTGWTKPDPEIYKLDYQLPGGAVVVRNNADLNANANASARGKKPKPPAEPPFVLKDLGLGLVVAIADVKPFPGSALNWRWLFNSIGPERRNWEVRHGLSVTSGNPSFDEFTIADVGLPPVKAYRVLITLFVVAIGPVNYWLLRRKGRLHLLLFTVPAAAIVVSLSLVAYAVVADGFDTYLRARSFTKLDQRRDEAVSWARLSYYAGLAPAEGLHFQRDTAVLPVEREGFYQSSIHPLRQTDWTSAQHLVRGWVPSRTPTQFVTVRPYACRRELRILETDEPAACAVENRLGTKVKHLLLRSAGDKLYYGHDIDAGGRAALAELNDDDKIQEATLKVLNARSEGAPEAPQASGTTASELFFGRSRRYRFPRGNFSLSQSSLLDTSLAQAFSDVGSHLPNPRTYVAIVERPPDVTVGVDDLVERQSLHVIFATW